MRSLVLHCICLALVAWTMATAASRPRRVDNGPQRLDSTSARALQVGVSTQQTTEDCNIRQPARADSARAAVVEAKGSSSQVEPGSTALPAQSPTEKASWTVTDEKSALGRHLVEGTDKLATTVNEPDLEAATISTNSALRKRCHYIGTFFRRIDCNAPADSTAIPYSHASDPMATQA